MLKGKSESLLCHCHKSTCTPIEEFFLCWMFQSAWHRRAEFQICRSLTLYPSPSFARHMVALPPRATPNWYSDGKDAAVDKGGVNFLGE